MEEKEKADNNSDQDTDETIEQNSSEVLKSPNQDVEEYVFKSKLFRQIRQALR